MYKFIPLTFAFLAPFAASAQDDSSKKQWLAGDHHIHSQYSVKWDDSVTPPAPIIAGDARYPTELNAKMGHKHGLSWMVTTDHGGPNHSKFNLEVAYPALLKSRKDVPGIIQFYGMELDTPGAEHSSMIIPHTHDEVDRLHHLEKNFARKDAHPYDPARDTEEKMLEALTAMKKLPVQPILIVNHPSRSAKGLGEYGANTPRELRNWNDTAPTISIGMEGSPGHQARALHPDGTIDDEGQRGSYRNYPTMGGFDQMTARLGGFWDSMLGEGRHWWVTSSSDSHVHYSEGGSDFWPGEYAKTYVYAEKNYDAILNGMRSGNIFVTTGDLLSELYVTAENTRSGEKADIGDTLNASKGDNIRVTVKFLDPDSKNARDENPSVNRVDVISGEVGPRHSDKTIDTNPTTKVVGRYSIENWTKEGPYTVISYVIEQADTNSYVRIRGTNGDELEPAIDPKGEDPWSDLWFYSNPIFIKIEK